MQNIFKFLHSQFKWGKALLLETNAVEKLSEEIKKIIELKIFNIIPGNLLTHPDFLEISIEAGSKYINLNQIRKMSLFLQNSSIYSGKKIVLMKNAETLNIYSGNAILKQIEELSENNLVIFITLNFNMVLSSIHNRCIRLRKIYDFQKEKFELKYGVFFLQSVSVEDKILFVEDIISSNNKLEWSNFVSNTEILVQNLFYKSISNLSLSEIEEKIFFQFQDVSSKSFFLLMHKVYKIFNDQIKYDLDLKTSIILILNEFL